MRLRLTLDSIVLLDLTLFETEHDDSAPADLHDLSTGHDIGFAAPVGWAGGDTGQSDRRGT